MPCPYKSEMLRGVYTERSRRAQHETYGVAATVAQSLFRGKRKLATRTRNPKLFFIPQNRHRATAQIFAVWKHAQTGAQTNFSVWHLPRAALATQLPDRL